MCDNKNMRCYMNGNHHSSVNLISQGCVIIKEENIQCERSEGKSVDNGRALEFTTTETNEEVQIKSEIASTVPSNEQTGSVCSTNICYAGMDANSNFSQCSSMQRFNSRSESSGLASQLGNLLSIHDSGNLTSRRREIRSNENNVSSVVEKPFQQTECFTSIDQIKLEVLEDVPLASLVKVEDASEYDALSVQELSTVFNYEVVPKVEKDDALDLDLRSESSNLAAEKALTNTIKSGNCNIEVHSDRNCVPNTTSCNQTPEIRNDVIDSAVDQSDTAMDVPVSKRTRSSLGKRAVSFSSANLSTSLSHKLTEPDSESIVKDSQERIKNPKPSRKALVDKTVSVKSEPNSSYSEGKEAGILAPSVIPQGNESAISEPKIRKRKRTPKRKSVSKRRKKSKSSYICIICTPIKRFARSRNLIRHLWVHGKNKSFGCNFCEQKFETAGRLSAHEISHVHNEDINSKNCVTQEYGEKPNEYKCKVCDFTSNAVQELEVHICYPKPKEYKCFSCPQVFLKRSDRDAHSLQMDQKPLPGKEVVPKTALRNTNLDLASCRNNFVKETDADLTPVLTVPNATKSAVESKPSEELAAPVSTRTRKRPLDKVVESYSEDLLSSSDSDSGHNDPDPDFLCNDLEETDTSSSRWDPQLLKKKIFFFDSKESKWIPPGSYSGQKTNWTCPFCPTLKPFPKLCRFQAHLWKHGREKSFLCETCNQTFKSAGALCAHELTHTNSEHAKSDTGGATSSNQNQNVFKCRACNIITETILKLKQHSCYPTSTTSEYKCLQCPEIFFCKFELDKHIRKNHPNCLLQPAGTSSNNNADETQFKSSDIAESPLQELKPQATSERNISLPARKQKTGFICPSCSKPFAKITHFQAHLWKHSQEKSFICKVCLQRFETAGYFCAHELTHIDSDHSKNTTNGDASSNQSLSEYKCRACNLITETILELEKHCCYPILTRKFECLYCPEIFFYKIERDQHCQRIHPEYGEVLCLPKLRSAKNPSITTELSPTPSDSKTEAASIVTNTRSSQRSSNIPLSFNRYRKCPACPRTVFRKGFTKHLWNHGQHKSFGCNFCSLKFETSGALSAHRLTHDSNGQPDDCKATSSITEKILFKCCVCNESTGTLLELEAHNCYSIVGQFQCPRCPKIFYDRCRLEFHIVNHEFLDREQSSFGNKAGSSVSDNLETNSCTSRPKRITDCFYCPVCSKKLKKMRNYVIHMWKHGKKSEFSCKTCNLNFRSGGAWSAHKLSHESFNTCNALPTSYKCVVCMMVADSAVQLEAHVCYSMLTEYKCSQCPKVFGCKSRLEAHARYHMPKQKTLPVQCKLCNKFLASESILERHDLIVHRKEQRFKCVLCKNKYFSEKSLENHKCKKKNRYPDKKIGECPVCQRTVFNILMTTHLRTHTKEKRYVCETCGKKFKTNCGLKSHAITHSDERPELCNFCAKSFKKKLNLQRHIDSVHNKKENSFHCDICGKDFAPRDNYVRHLRTHTGEKPYECRICGHRAIQASTLKSHIKVHHKNVDVANSIVSHFSNSG